MIAVHEQLGNIIQNSFVADATACKTACTDDDDCAAFSVAPNLCFLHLGSVVEEVESGSWSLHRKVPCPNAG